MYLVIAAVIVAILMMLILLHRNIKADAQRKNIDQVNRKMREKQLDMALTNPLHYSRKEAIKTASNIDYRTVQNSRLPGPALRLTKKDARTEQSYFFDPQERVFLGVDHGYPVVLRAGDEQFAPECELFYSGNGWYARILRNRSARLLRGRYATELDGQGIRLNDGDILKNSCGQYRIELLEIPRTKKRGRS